MISRASTWESGRSESVTMGSRAGLVSFFSSVLVCFPSGSFGFSFTCSSSSSSEDQSIDAILGMTKEGCTETFGAT